MNDTTPSKRKQRLNLYGTNTEFTSLQRKLDQAKSISHRISRNSLDILNIALSQYLQSMTDESHQLPCTQQYCKKENSSEPLVVTSHSALENLVRIINKHSINCKREVTIRIKNEDNFRKSCDLTCDACRFNCAWKSSLDLPNGKDLITTRITHAFLSSGMLVSQLNRFSCAFGIGTITSRTINENVQEYSAVVCAERTASCERALHEEKKAGEDSESVDIITDARHSTRRNSKYTDVVCIGYAKHKVIDHVTVRREDDPCSQRHEMFGTKRIYEGLSRKDITVRRHGHDRNASINKYVREQHPNTINQNDTWHVSVSVEKQMKKIAGGAKCREGKTWSVQLVDKVKPVKTHMQYAMRTCNGDPSILRENMLNIVKHYKNIHYSCSADSRCRTDSNYVPSRLVITDSIAARLLEQMIKTTDIYKHPEHYVHAMDTCYVESFNNVLNIFHDKRIGSFGDKHYKLRSDMAICHWNENVGKGSKNTYTYRENIWARLMSAIYPCVIWRPF